MPHGVLQALALGFVFILAAGSCYLFARVWGEFADLLSRGKTHNKHRP